MQYHGLGSSSFILYADFYGLATAAAATLAAFTLFSTRNSIWKYTPRQINKIIRFVLIWLCTSFFALALPFRLVSFHLISFHNSVSIVLFGWRVGEFVCVCACKNGDRLKHLNLYRPFSRALWRAVWVGLRSRKSERVMKSIRTNEQKKCFYSRVRELTYNVEYMHCVCKSRRKSLLEIHCHFVQIVNSQSGNKYITYIRTTHIHFAVQTYMLVGCMQNEVDPDALVVL